MPALDEFSLIARFFTHPGKARQGVGDDCALIDVGDQTLAITSDMLVEGVHFFSDDAPEDIAHKALAVNLSDLAAAGARPSCFLLDLALPGIHETWLQRFSDGLMGLANRYQCDLIGGDTTRMPAWPPSPQAGQGPLSASQATAAGSRSAGPLTVAITAIGDVPRTCLRGRDGAKPGDDIWVSGVLGDAAFAVHHKQSLSINPVPPLGAHPIAGPDKLLCFAKLNRPEPRVALGMALRGLASAAADISDGLTGDLGHILKRSGVGAHLDWPRVPYSAALADLDPVLRQQCVLAGGDDYELVFTAPAWARPQILALATTALPLTCVGTICTEPGLHWVGLDGTRLDPPQAPLRSFNHFTQGMPNGQQ